MPLNLGGGSGSVTYSGGRFYNNGVLIDPSEFTLTQFQNLVSSDYSGQTVRITNVHSTSSGSGGVLLTGGSVWILESAQIYQSTFATALTNFPAATYPGIRIQCGDVVPLLESNGTRYKPKAGQGYLFNEVNGTEGVPTKTIGSGSAPQLFSLSNPNIPANLVQAGDVLWLEFDAQRHGVGAMTLTVALGTSASSLSDAVMWSNALAATDLANAAGFIKIIIGSATSASTNSVNSIQQTSGSGAGTRAEVTTNLNFAADQVLKIGLSAKTTSTDSIDLLQASCLWRPAL